MFNNIEKLISHNKTYEEKKEKLNKEYKILQQFNDKFDLDLLRKLSYQEIKEIYKLIRFSFGSKSQIDKLEEIYKEAKLKEYPQLNKAHYYPVINKIDFLNDEQKKELDHILMKSYNNYIYTDSELWYNFDKETTNKILKFLCDNGVIMKVYKIYCHCGSSECLGEYITEEQYKKFIEYHSITKEEKDKWTDEEWEDYDKKFNEGYIEVGCWNDGNYEICSIEDWNNARKSLLYENIIKPDRSLDEI